MMTACKNKKHVKFQNTSIGSQLNSQTYHSLIADFEMPLLLSEPPVSCPLEEAEPLR